MAKTTLKISWMHCASCSLLVEKSLSKKKWVKKISVNLASNSVNINYDESVIDVNTLSKEIGELGYNVVQQLDNNAAQGYLKKFLIALALSLPIGATMFVNIKEIFGVNSSYVDWVLLLLGTIVVFVAGWNFHVGFIKKLLKWQSNMDTLISIGTLVAWGYSVYSFVQTYFVWNEMYFYHFLEWAAFIITFISLGKYLELKSKWRASNAIQKLMQLQAKEAIVLKAGQEIKVSIDDIKVWDIVVVRAGDKIAVDGDIIKGASSIDESMLTGESMPVSKQENDSVFTWTIVQNWTLQIKVTKEQWETMLAKIVQTVNEAQSSKPPIQHLADQISGVFVPVILVIAVIIFALRYWQTGSTEMALLYMVATIVIACPCAMWLATPMAIMVATGTWASRWILIKWGEVLEKSKNIDVVVFDKTGTLTEWKPKVTDIIGFDFLQEKALKISASLSILSHHPLSQAIVQHANEKGVETTELDKFEEIGGKWLSGYCPTHKVRILFGNKKLLEHFKIELSEKIQDRMDKLSCEGKTPNILVRDGKIIALIALMDTPKADSHKGIKALHEMGIQSVIISGDTKKTVKAVAEQLAMDNYYGEVYPEKKAEIVKELQAQGKKVAFVWDGINDAPALAQSDLGIAIGQWTDVAIETADMVLVQGNPYKVVEAIKLARKTYKIIKQNLFWAFAYNSILIPVAALGYLLPMFASLAMSMSSVSVVLNSLRLKKI